MAGRTSSGMRLTSTRVLGCLLAACVSLALIGAPAHAADPVIAAAGDIACDTRSEFWNGGFGTDGHCRQRATSDLLVNGGLSAVLALGDTQYHVGALSDFEASFDPSWGRVKPIIRPIVGNHEYGTSDARGYFDYFNGPDQQNGPAGPRDKGYYSYNLGSWHLVALNSNCDQLDRGAAANGCAPGSPQEHWLRTDLAAERKQCTLAYMHSPRFNSGYRGNSSDGPGLLGGALRGRRRPRAERRCPRLRALRASGPARQLRSRPGHPPVRGRDRGRLLHRLEHA